MEGVEWVEDGVVEGEHFCGEMGVRRRGGVGPGEKAVVGGRWRATRGGNNIKCAYVPKETCEL